MTEQDMTGDELRAEFDMLEAAVDLGIPEGMKQEALTRMEAIAEEIKDRNV